jgi:hypothetical protein
VDSSKKEIWPKKMAKRLATRFSISVAERSPKITFIKRFVQSFVMFFRNTDFLMDLQELEEYEKNGSVQLRLAFSRDQPHKIYVTHLLQEDSDKLWEVIGEKKGHLYICG